MHDHIFSDSMRTMLKIRLQRIGRKNDPSFRVIVTDSRNPAKRGRYVELLGTFNPHKDTPVINAERIQYWISKGAQPSITVHNMLISGAVISGKKINALPKKTVIKKDAPAESTSAETTAEVPAEASSIETPVAEEVKTETPVV